MDDPHYGVKNANALDMIAHSLHMQELWNRAGKAFKRLNTNKLPKNKCKCLEEIYGDMTALVMAEVAKQIRTPELVYTNPDGTNSTDAGYSVYKYSFSFRRIIGSGGKQVASPSIVDENTWVERREGMFIPGEELIEEGRQLAIYIFCKLNYQ